MASKKKKKTAAKTKVAKKKKLPKGKSASKKVKKPLKRDSKGRFLPAPKPKPKKVKAKKSKPKTKKKVKKKLVALPIPLPESRREKPKRRKRKYTRQDIRYIQVGNYEDYSTATHMQTDAKQEHYKNFSHLTRSDIDGTQDGRTATIGAVFDAAITGHLIKGSLEWEDLRIFSYGILLRADDREITPSLISEIAIILQGFKPQIIVAQEDTGQNAIMINFGYEDRRLSVDRVFNRINAYSAALQEVYMLLYDELGADIDWSVWWDTDVMMYE